MFSKKKENTEKVAEELKQVVGDKSLFQADSLQKMADAAKKLEGNANAKEIYRIVQEGEVTKQKQYEAEHAKYSMQQEHLALERAKEEEQIYRRNLEAQRKLEQSKADYMDELERKRIREQLQIQKQLQEEERVRNEESQKRLEALRRETVKYEAELREATELAKVRAEAEGNILRERQNHDLVVDKIKLESEEKRTTLLEAIKLSTERIGKGISEFTEDKERLTNVGAFLAGTVITVYAGRAAIGVMAKVVEARIGKPSLVRDTSRIGVKQIVTSPLQSFKYVFGKNKAESALENVVLEPSLDHRLRRVAVSTANTKSNRAPFRHLLLHGPPGTGKTMFAKGLALKSGMHYAIMTGGDIAPLGKDAVTEIHKLFDWANTTRKGVVIFVDEADAFLRKRSTERISEDMRNALNAFLYRTGEASKKFMIVYASNQPEQFDWAINDRIDEMVEFKLPGFDERVRMITQYINQYLRTTDRNARTIVVNDVDDELINEIAWQTEGYSGREISKLAIAWQAAAYGSANAVIDGEMMKVVLGESKESKKQKQSWLSKEELLNLTKDSKN